MEHVRHHGLSDCGVCALATATGVSWETARDAIFDDGKPRRRFSSTGKQVIHGAEALGFKSMHARLKPLKEGGWYAISLFRGQVAIVKIQYQDSRCAHWVVWDGEQVWDSNFEGPMYEHAYQYRPLSFIILEDDI